MTNRDRIAHALAIIAAHLPDGVEDQVHALRTIGLNEGEAQRLVAFAPSALARPILERLGVTAFAATALIARQDGSWMEIKLADQPEYLEMLSLARDHVLTGVLPRDVFETIVLSSAELASVNEALNNGSGVTGGTVATVFHDTGLIRHVIP